MVFKINSTLAAVAVLVGTIIGAGFLGIPYMAAKSGFLFAGIQIVLLGAIMLIINLYLGEIALRTEGNKQLPGFAEKYLGKTGKVIMLIVLIFDIFASLLAYTVGVGESLSHLIFSSGAYSVHMSIAFWLFMSFITFFGIKTFKEGEVAGLFLVGALLISVIVWLAPKINIANLNYLTPKFFFVPFGTILYALLSIPAIPELERILSRRKNKMKKAIIIGSLIPPIGYFLFTLVLVGTKGSAVPEVATISLGPVFILLGIITMSTSYLAFATVMKSMLHYDYKVKKHIAWLVVSLVIINLFLFATKLSFTFTKILGVTGIISGTMIAILAILMLEKAKKKGDRIPEYTMPLNKFIMAIIILIFLIGAFMNIWKF